MAELFAVSKANISMLIAKIFADVFTRPTKQEWKDKAQGEFAANGKNLKA
jgi:hypothetical protein